MKILGFSKNNRLDRVIKNVPFYILFFSWYSILFLYSQNYIELSFKVVLLPIAITTVSCLIFWEVFRIILKTSIRSGILVGILVLIIFMYGPLHSLSYFNTFNIWLLPIDWSYLYIALSVVLILITLIFIKKNKRDLFRLNEVLNIGSFILILMVVVPLVVSYSQIHLANQQDGILDGDEALESQSANIDQNISVKPDIYYIIPDDYGSPQIMQQDYGYDDSLLINYLKDKGFYIGDKSKTNYPFSTFMIAAALNMEYLNSKNFPQIKSQPGGTVINNALQDSKVLQFIKRQGYSYFNIGSWYDPLRVNNLADINFTYDNKLNLDEFSETLLHNTIFYPLIVRYFGISGQANQAASTFYQYQTLENMPYQISPKFVFVDVLSPHTPYIFDPNCNIVKESNKAKEIAAFTQQVGCVNKKLIAVIDSILNNSATPPIIILQTDEGAKDSDNLALKYPDEKGVSGGFEDSTPETDLERTSILSAFYLPGDHANLLYSGITPVNTFRVVFDNYFDAKLPLLPDRIYNYDDYDKLYKFIFNDITSKVKDK